MGSLRTRECEVGTSEIMVMVVGVTTDMEAGVTMATETEMGRTVAMALDWGILEDDLVAIRWMISRSCIKYTPEQLQT
jgi:hypothetical protein